MCSDQNESSLFKDVSAGWWGQGSPPSLSLEASKWVRSHHDLLSEIYPERVVDIGTYQGRHLPFSRSLVGSGEVVAVDRQDQRLPEFTAFADRFIEADFDAMPERLPKDYFDVVLFCRVLHHCKSVEGMRKTLRALADCLHERGRMVGSTRAMYPALSASVRLSTKGPAGSRVDTYLSFDELSCLLKLSGFDVLQIEPILEKESYGKIEVSNLYWAFLAMKA